MPVRMLALQLLKHRRYILRSYWNRVIHTNILDQPHGVKRPVSLSANINLWFRRAVKNDMQKVVSRSTNKRILRVGHHTRRLFVDNILSHVTTSYSDDLRQGAIKKLFYSDSSRLFAFIDVSLSNYVGMLSKEDELEGICWKIRDTASCLLNLWDKDKLSYTLNSNFSINNLDVGPPIATGCSAVVYAAAFKQCGEIYQKKTCNFGELKNCIEPIVFQYPRPVVGTRQNMSEIVGDYDSSDNVRNCKQGVTLTKQLSSVREIGIRSSYLDQGNIFKIGQQSSDIRTYKDLHFIDSTKSVSNDQYPLALKIMFNYDIESTALSIIRAMYKETIPARQSCIDTLADEWKHWIQNHILTLPPHPNIVFMFGFFSDEIRDFTDGHLLYPSAQPQRINPVGCGRNMSLYLLMKRYDLNLRNFLNTYEISTRTKLFLLAQLLEAIAHINRYSIAHRDLKSDNLLIELNDFDISPLLVVSDFGCCLADKVHGLKIPYNSYDVDKGGNIALMAPEIINKQPGPFSELNYKKSDLWACGAIAYEIFNLQNPFYLPSGNMTKSKAQFKCLLQSSNYKPEDLPELGDTCPFLIKHLIYNILNPNPSKRISPDMAANVLQLYLWAPSKWLKSNCAPDSTQIFQWLLSLTTKVLCEGHVNTVNEQNMASSFPCIETLLICSFLTRAHLRQIRGALNWVRNYMV